MPKTEKHIEQLNMVEEGPLEYGFVSKSEEERLKEDVFRSDMEKIRVIYPHASQECLSQKGNHYTY